MHRGVINMRFQINIEINESQTADEDITVTLSDNNSGEIISKRQLSFSDFERLTKLKTLQELKTYFKICKLTQLDAISEFHDKLDQLTSTYN